MLLDSLDCGALIKSARGDPLSNNVLMALRILAYTMTVDQLRMLAGFLLGDDTATWFPHSNLFTFLVHLEECGVCLDCSKEHWLFSQ